jgi:hypothetical protein
MFKRKVLLVALALALVLGLASGAFAVEDVTAGHSIEFKDMPEEGFWSYSALNAAVENGLLNGFEEGGARYIKPEASLTRAQMATIVNRAFGAQAAAALTGVTDVPSYTWYAPEMQKAVQMGTFMLDTKMRPNDSITRQEAFVVLARAFKLQDADKAYKPLNSFSDKADIADWAKPNLSAMAGAGYIQGSGGYLQPKASITRAEFATVMDNMVKQYIDVAGTYTAVVADGNVIIRVPGVTLDGVKVKGDLVIGDGVGEGDAILKNITVTGRALIRGGGENSVKFIGSETDVQNIVIARGSDGKVRILTEDGAVLAEAEVDSDGDVILEGTFGSVTVLADDITVTAVGATLTDVAVDGQNSQVILGTGTTAQNVSINGAASSVVVEEGASAKTVEISAPDASVSGGGTVENVSVQSGGDNASVTTPNTVTTVATNVEGVTAGGKDVPPGATATNNDTGTDATIDDPKPPSGGTPAMSISIEKVMYDGGERTKDTNGVYSLPPGADEEKASIDVSIKNTRAGDYNVKLTIKNASGLIVAEATSSGLKRQYLDALDVYGPVTFDDIAGMFDRLGTNPSGYYLKQDGSKVEGDTESKFKDAIQATFGRMRNGEVYTVTVEFGGAASASLQFKVMREEPA